MIRDLAAALGRIFSLTALPALMCAFVVLAVWPKQEVVLRCNQIAAHDTKMINDAINTPRNLATTLRRDQIHIWLENMPCYLQDPGIVMSANHPVFIEGRPHYKARP